MDAKIREMILRDYESVNGSIARILGDPSRNGIVLDPDYDTPSCVWDSTDLASLSDEKREFQYFIRIRSALEAALSSGKIPAKLAPPRAPFYIEDLVEK